jgi:hypothetical protein
MAVEAFVSLKKAVTLFTKFPFNDGTVLGMTQLEQIATRMVSNLVESFLSFMAILWEQDSGLWELDSRRN